MKEDDVMYKDYYIMVNEKNTPVPIVCILLYGLNKIILTIITMHTNYNALDGYRISVLRIYQGIVNEVEHLPATIQVILVTPSHERSRVF